MPDIARLVDIQRLDLEADALHKRHAELPEREARSACDTELAALETAAAEISARRETLARAEHVLELDVEQVAAKAKGAEDTLYSGTVTVAKELETLAEEVRVHKARQDELELQELELLEQIEAVEDELAVNSEIAAAVRSRAAELDAAISGTEAEIAGALEGLEQAVGSAREDLPSAVLEAYAKLRDQPRLVGRAAARLVDKLCEGCRVDQPVLECKRMRDEPWDAVVCCVHCGRLLVR